MYWNKLTVLSYQCFGTEKGILYLLKRYEMLQKNVNHSTHKVCVCVCFGACWSYIFNETEIFNLLICCFGIQIHPLFATGKINKHEKKKTQFSIIFSQRGKMLWKPHSIGYWNDFYEHNHPDENDYWLVLDYKSKCWKLLIKTYRKSSAPFNSFSLHFAQFKFE